MAIIPCLQLVSKLPCLPPPKKLHLCKKTLGMLQKKKQCAWPGRLVTKRESPKLQSIRIKLCGTLNIMVSPQQANTKHRHYSVKHLSSISHIILSILKHPSIHHHHPSNPTLPLPYPTLSYPSTPTMGEERTWPGLARPCLGFLSSMHCMAWHADAVHA